VLVAARISASVSPSVSAILNSKWYGDTDQWICKNADGHVNPDLGGIGVGKNSSMPNVSLLTQSR
jgi:hypothetical protein